MIYYYRWLMASVLSVCLGLTGFFYDIFPRYLMWQQTNSKAQTLQATWRQQQHAIINKKTVTLNEAIPNFRYQPISGIMLLQQLGLLIERHHLKIVGWRPGDFSSSKDQFLHVIVVLRGECPAFYQFFQQLFMLSHPVFISFFKFLSPLMIFALSNISLILPNLSSMTIGFFFFLTINCFFIVSHVNP